MHRKRRSHQFELIGARPVPLGEPERLLAAEGFRRIAGVDEAGRGPLAGPVVAAAVVLPTPFDPALLPGLGDSKTLSAAQRETLFEKIPTVARGYGIGRAEPEEIDRTNILVATLEAMRRAVAALPESPDLVLLDGNQLIPAFPIPQRALVHGDARACSIAAASILAKVTRDRIMDEMDAKYPGYGFARHKGYGTAEHRRAILERGPSPIHRASFRVAPQAGNGFRDARAVGVRGEELAREFLEQKGLRIVAHDFACPEGEVDLIAEDGEFLVFVEVKARAGGRFGSALEAVTPRKARRLVRAAEEYLFSRGLDGVPVRFDVVTVDLSGRRPAVQHLTDAFRPEEE